MTRKKKAINKSTAKGMLDLEKIFEDRRNVICGLDKEEMIALFRGLSLKKVRGMRPLTIQQEMNTVRTIRKHLLESERMVIYSKKMPRGTMLSCKEFGQRVLSRATNIYFRCFDIVDASVISNNLFKVSNGIARTADRITEVTSHEEKKEEERKKEKEVIQVVKNGKKS